MEGMPLRYYARVDAIATKKREEDQDELLRGRQRSSKSGKIC